MFIERTLLKHDNAVTNRGFGSDVEVTSFLKHGSANGLKLIAGIKVKIAVCGYDHKINILEECICENKKPGARFEPL